MKAKGRLLQLLTITVLVVLSMMVVCVGQDTQSVNQNKTQTMTQSIDSEILETYKEQIEMYINAEVEKRVQEKMEEVYASLHTDEDVVEVSSSEDDQEIEVTVVIEEEVIEEIVEEVNSEELKQLERERIDTIHYNPKNVTEPSNMTVEDIRILLEDTPLAGTEYAFYNIEKDSGINAFYAISVAYQECGRKFKEPRVVNNNNIFGIMGNPYYKSKQECIYYFADFTQRLYLNQGLTSVYTIQPKYCPPDKTWSGDVASFMKEHHTIITSKLTERLLE